MIDTLKFYADFKGIMCSVLTPLYYIKGRDHGQGSKAIINCWIEFGNSTLGSRREIDQIRILDMNMGVRGMESYYRK